jgi:hypothetical protein
VAAARAARREIRPSFDPERLVFIDKARGQHDHGPPQRPRTPRRAAAGRAVDALRRAIATALEAFTPDECRTCIANRGCSHP